MNIFAVDFLFFHYVLKVLCLMKLFATDICCVVICKRMLEGFMKLFNIDSFCGHVWKVLRLMKLFVIQFLKVRNVGFPIA